MPREQRERGQREERVKLLASSWRQAKSEEWKGEEEESGKESGWVRKKKKRRGWGRMKRSLCSKATPSEILSPCPYQGCQLM